MGFRSTTLLALALVASLGCGQKRETERKEYKALRAQLLRISRTHTDKLVDELDRLEAIEITTERIDTCRDACSEAYRAIAEASDKSHEAKAIIADLEETVETEQELEVLEKSQEKALHLLEESEADLERAKELKDRCHDLLDDLEGEGLDRDR